MGRQGVMGHANGKFLTTDLSGVNYSALAYNGNQFTSQEVPVHDTDTLSVFHQAIPNSTSGDENVTFTYGFSPDDNKTPEGNRIWTGTSNYPTSKALSIIGSGTGLSGAQIDSQLIDVESVGWVRLEGVYNNTTSTPVNFVNVHWGKSW